MSNPNDNVRNTLIRLTMGRKSGGREGSEYLASLEKEDRDSTSINIGGKEPLVHTGSPGSDDKSTMKRDGLGPIHFAAYAVGHVYNDLCATCWFLYLLYFLTEVRKWSEAKAGFAVLAGQIADGIATQLVGYLSDKFNPSIGKRALWYIIGFIIVLP